MKKSGTNRLRLFPLLSPWCVLLLSACNPAEIDFPGPPATVNLSGRVISIGLSGLAPLAGATVALLDGSKSTVSGDGGSWTLEEVPNGPDPVLKVTVGGVWIPYPPAYNTYPLSLKIPSYDLQIMDPLLYLLMVLEHLMAGASINKICLVFGAAVGFASMDPLVTQPLAESTVHVLPDDLKVVYLDGDGMPDPTLTETSGSGAFLVVVPDATALPTIVIYGARGGQFLVGSPYQPTYPGGFLPTGLIDPFFVP